MVLKKGGPMRLLLAILVGVFGFQIAKAEVPAHVVSTHREFPIRSSFGPGGHVYYNCDSVEAAVKDLLSQLGARRINVRCTGGIDEGRPPMDAYVEVSFRALKLAAINDTGIVMANWKWVQIHSWDDCYLKNEIFENVKTGFSMMDVSKARSCSRVDSQFRARLRTLF
jgi:hypothetical protein